MAPTSRKRLFIGLLAGSCTIFMGLLALLWIVPYYGLEAIHPWAKYVLGGALAVVMALVSWSVIGLVLNIWLGRPVVFTKRLRGVTIKLFLPFMTLLGRLVGVSKERVRTSFINVNNEMVLAEAGKYKPGEILLLMPHCIQNSLCKRRLTYDINNCKRCGDCPIAGLLTLHDRYGVHLAIATGGTVARRIVVQKRPRMIVAVACDRDLASGIQDTYPLPVFGVMNERPHGPCLDTTVGLEDVERAMLRFLDPVYLPEDLGGAGPGEARGQAIATAQAARADTPEDKTEHAEHAEHAPHAAQDA